MIYEAQKITDKQLLPNITEGFSVRFGAYGKDWDAGCWAKWTKEWIWNVSKVRVTMLNRAQWSSGHMQGCCSVGAWVQQNVWILHKPKEGGKNSGTSRKESQHSLVSALMRMVSAAQHAWDYACLRVCVIITRCTSAVVCGFRSAWAWQLGSRQNPGDLNPTCCLTLSAAGGSRETAILHHKGSSLVTSPSFAPTLPCNCSQRRSNVKADRALAGIIV